MENPIPENPVSSSVESTAKLQDSQAPDAKPEAVSETIATPEPAAPPIDPAQLAMESREILDNLLRRLGFEVKMESEIENGTLRFQLECEDPGRLIGRKGSTINELQFLLNRILQRRHPVVPRIFLDVEGPMGEAPQQTSPSTGSGPSGRPPAHPQASPQSPLTSAPSSPSATREKVEPPKVEPPKQSPVQQLIQRIKALRDQVHRWGDPVDAGVLTPAEKEIALATLGRDPEVELVSLEPSADPAKPQKMQLRVKGN